jgi:hypothetical protein
MRERHSCSPLERATLFRASVRSVATGFPPSCVIAGMRRDEEEELTHLRAVLAQLTDARRKAEWLLETAAAESPMPQRGGPPTVRRPAPPS